MPEIHSDAARGLPATSRFRVIAVLPLVIALFGGPLQSLAASETPPNVVIIFTDDQGYADVGCYGATGFQTPHLDRLASQGMRFTNFYVAQAVCGASRAALLTGCYPNRIGMLGAPSHASTHGIHPREVLVSELMKQRGYATSVIGKWHLGHRRESLPLQHGFDEYFGLPYSNDMWPFHPEAKNRFPDLPLIEGNEFRIAAVTSADQTRLTTWYTKRAVDFVERHRSQPFLLYLAHSMPHVPLFVSEERSNSNAATPYGVVIEEIDWSVGQVMQALKRNGLTHNTLVIFTTDNGPWLSYGNHAGSAGPLREGKGTTWEGGVRVPCIMHWPGRIPAGAVCDELAATIDIFPTLAKLVDAELPEHPIDGKDIWPLMAGHEGATTPHEAYYYYWGHQLQAIRSGDWKLHFPHEYRSLTGTPGRDGQPAGYTQQETGLALYNLRDDIGETTDVKDRHPDIVARLEQLAEIARQELGDSARNLQGRGYRPPMQFDE